MRGQKALNGRRMFSIVLDHKTYNNLQREAEQQDKSKALLISEILKERYELQK